MPINFSIYIKNLKICFFIGCFCVISIFGFNHRKKIILLERSYNRQIFQKAFSSYNFPEWMISQIETDLNPFKNQQLSTAMIDKAVENYLASSLGQSNVLELARCRIQNNKISIHCLPPTKRTEERLFTVINAFQRLMLLMPMPDLDFIICIGDSLHSDASSFFKDIPILTFAKQINDTISVLIPDCEALSEGLYERILKETTYGRHQYPWHTKEEKAFWRGATTGYDKSGYNSLNLTNYQEFPRIKLVQLSSQYPLLIDAKFCILAQIEDAKVHDLLTPYIGRSVPILDHLKYKYQVLVDGNTCAYSRAYWQLFSNCLIFKQTSSHIQWYYRALKPYVHYVPVSYDLSDLVEKIEWANNHDSEAKQIVENANLFAEQNLNKHGIYLYLCLFVHKYAELFQRAITN